MRVNFRQNLLPEKGRFAVKRKRFSVEQIVAVLKQVEVGSASGGTDPAGGDQRADAVSVEEAVQGAGNRFARTRAEIRA